MLTFQTPRRVHEIEFLSSGSTKPRELTVEVLTVGYSAAEWDKPPTFLATADLQGREKRKSNRLLGELVAEEVQALQELDVLPAFDFTALCGDFYDYPDLRKLGGTGDVTPALNALATLAPETYVVLGNHDEVDATQLRSEVRILDGDVVKTDSVTIGGVSGIVGSPRRNNRKTEADFLSAIQRCSTARTDMLLLHQGPHGATDAERGLESINQFLKRRNRLLLLFGHCHWGQPFHREGSNVFCNVDSRILVFIPD